MSIITKPNNAFLRFFTLNVFVLFCGILLCGFISVYLGKDLSWDLANYHYYNAFAFFHHRLNHDIWPFAFIHAYFTPTMDFLPYFLINHVSSLQTMFYMGALHGINFWLIFYISVLGLRWFPRTTYPNATAISLALIGLYGPAALSGMGSFQQDNTVSLFVLAFILLQLKTWQAYMHTARLSGAMFFLSSVPLGVAIGCKLTAGFYLGGALLAFLFMRLSWSHKIKILFLFGLGASLGLLCAAGYWMLFLWQHFQNPFFPFFNHLFHSPYFPDNNWHDVRFLPQGIAQTLFFPFFFSWNSRISELPFMDFRFALLYIAFIYYAWVRLHERRETHFNLALQWFLLFFISSYIIWQYYFSNLRYMVSLEMLAPLAIYLLLQETVRRPASRKLWVFSFCLFIFFTMSPVKTIRAPWYGNSYFNIQLPELAKTNEPAVVLMPISAFADYLDPRPQTYLIPFLPSQWRFVGIAFFGKKYLLSETLHHLKKPAESIYLLAPAPYMPILQQITRKLGFSGKAECGAILSDRQKITHQELLLCKIK